MENDPLRQQIAAMKQSLLNEGTVESHFFHMEQHQSSKDPNILEREIGLLYTNSMNITNNIEQQLENHPVDFTAITELVQQLRGMSARLGTKKVMERVLALLACCHERHVQRSKLSLPVLKLELETLKARLDSYFQLVRQARPANEAEAGPSQ
ncbi:pseudo histidine-containing phosphotransfer protein 5-like isoform X1 [Hevea brasiliensis]|uniref:pseudo histidine-containing phosphotransfer protein 5-like isoform X1 n=1 Tax=Hevea brasiliensis TaxID=3981 RepID=UPI0025EC6EDE|nr:pseudo histidine-containing phosphotransfer protein 5-like isoform X1 [Hevea brasiliensis]